MKAEKDKVKDEHRFKDQISVIQRVIAHRRGGRKAQFDRGGIQEHDAFLRHEMRGPAGTERGGVSMAGGREGQGARKGNGVKRLRQIGAEMV